MGKMKKTGHAFGFPECSLLQVFHFFGNAWLFCKVKNRVLETQGDHGSLVQPILGTWDVEKKVLCSNLSPSAMQVKLLPASANEIDFRVCQRLVRSGLLVVLPKNK
jgi:hypothetical protein